MKFQTRFFYNTDQSGLLYEHQQHFQPSSLEQLFIRHGFSQRYLSYDKCSRDFGFISVFEKSKSNLTFSSINYDVFKNFKIGRDKQIAFDEYPKVFFDKILNNSKVIVFWGVNANLEQLLRSNDLTSFQIITIDINPIKKSFVTPKYDFYTPDEFFLQFSKIFGNEKSIDEISFVITATEHYNIIKNQLISITDKIHVYDPIGRIECWRSILQQGKSCLISLEKILFNGLDNFHFCCVFVDITYIADRYYSSKTGIVFV